MSKFPEPTPVFIGEPQDPHLRRSMEQKAVRRDYVVAWCLEHGGEIIEGAGRYKAVSCEHVTGWHDTSEAAWGELFSQMQNEAIDKRLLSMW